MCSAGVRTRRFDRQPPRYNTYVGAGKSRLVKIHAPPM